LLRLNDVKTPLANFMASGLFELKEKLGPFLWQFPPNFAYDRDRLCAFFELLPRTCGEAAVLARKHDYRVTGRARLTPEDGKQPLRHAIEIRHSSFVQEPFIELPRDYGIALVVADTAGKWLLLEDVAAEHVYVRLHGDKKLYESGYSDVALARWARKIKAWMAGREASEARRASSQPALSVSGRDVYVYFDNDLKTHAPFDALRLARKIRTSAGRRAAVRGDAGYVTSGS
jgi:uncharacterized protein YecE (DUF72 family)